MWIKHRYMNACASNTYIQVKPNMLPQLKIFAFRIYPLVRIPSMKTILIHCSFVAACSTSPFSQSEMTLNYHKDEKFVQTHPPITKAIGFFTHAQYVSIQNCVLARCSLLLNCHNTKQNKLIHCIITQI
jgi:hypothetical protein